MHENVVRKIKRRNSRGHIIINETIILNLILIKAGEILCGLARFILVSGGYF
jgi:hypothetical protein